VGENLLYKDQGAPCRRAPVAARADSSCLRPAVVSARAAPATNARPWSGGEADASGRPPSWKLQRAGCGFEQPRLWAAAQSASCCVRQLGTSPVCQGVEHDELADPEDEAPDPERPECPAGELPVQGAVETSGLYLAAHACGESARVPEEPDPHGQAEDKNDGWSEHEPPATVR
jgi:hypothetical protein